MTEGQNVLGPEKVDSWLVRLEEANAEVCEEKKIGDKFVTGVPRDQKWVRVEPISALPTDRILQIANEQSLMVNPQKDGRLGEVFGQERGYQRVPQKDDCRSN